MNSLIVATVLLCATTPELPDGSLIFLDHSNNIVERYTDAKTTHVAIVINDKDGAWVYEAQPPKVRKVKLSEFYDDIVRLKRKRKKLRLWVYTPLEPYNDRQVKAMRDYLEQQVGRKYSIKSYLRGRELDGIHCSEMVSRALEKSQRFRIFNPARTSPGELLRRIKCSYTSIEVYIPILPKGKIKKGDIRYGGVPWLCGAVGFRDIRLRDGGVRCCGV